MIIIEFAAAALRVLIIYLAVGSIYAACFWAWTKNNPDEWNTLRSRQLPGMSEALIVAAVAVIWPVAAWSDICNLWDRISGR